MPADTAGPPSPEYAWLPFPTTVVIVPSSATRRTRLLAWSAINREPSAATAAASGVTLASVAGPPSPPLPDVPFPATVLITAFTLPAVRRTPLPQESVRAYGSYQGCRSRG